MTPQEARERRLKEVEDELIRRGAITTNAADLIATSGAGTAAERLQEATDVHRNSPRGFEYFSVADINTLLSEREIDQTRIKELKASVTAAAKLLYRRSVRAQSYKAIEWDTAESPRDEREAVELEQELRETQHALVAALQGTETEGATL